MGKDYYKLLGLGKDATEEEIKKAYKKLVSTNNSGTCLLTIKIPIS